MVAGSLARAEPLNHFEHQVTLAVDVGAILQAMVVTLRLRLLALVADPRERDQRQRRAVDVSGWFSPPVNIPEKVPADSRRS